MEGNDEQQFNRMKRLNERLIGHVSRQRQVRGADWRRRIRDVGSSLRSEQGSIASRRSRARAFARAGGSLREQWIIRLRGSFSGEIASAHTRSSARLAPAGWARSIAPATRSSVATSRSRCCRRSSVDPDRLARFEREAQVLASLNHPNIAAIYGFEERTPSQALVLELVEGPTLADRIAGGRCP